MELIKLIIFSVSTVNVETLGTREGMESQSCSHGAGELHGYMFINNPNQAIFICWALHIC